MNITIGEIVKAQGIKGEVKIKSFSDDLAHFSRLKVVLVGGCPFKLRSVNIRGEFVYAFFDGVIDRNAAEVLVGRKIEIDRSQGKSLSDGEYYVVDLIGCNVVLSDGTELGELKHIDNFGSADVFTVVGKRTVRFPHLKRLNLTFDREIKQIVLDKDRFEEVCCYED